MKKQRKRIIPTVGRIWGYIGVALALGTSLAGNVQSARLHTPATDPTWTEFAFSALPPLVAFVGIELVNHNPWGRVSWGKWITRVLLFVVVPGSALVSFAHLTLVGLDAADVDVPDRMQSVLNVATAVLTSLLVDGMILGGTGALLLPLKDAEKATLPVSEPVAAIEAYPDWRGEMGRMLADFNPLPPTNLEPLLAKIAELASLVEARPASVPRKPPVVKARLAEQESQEDKDKSRWPLGTHPLWKGWLAARGTKDAWDAERYVLETKVHMARDIKHTAAQSALNRWERAIEADPSLLV